MHSTAAKHKHDSAALRYTLGPIGLLAAMAMLAVSATMNYRFGYSLGKTPLDGEIYGWASVAADAFKAISPFFFFAAFRTRNWPVAIATSLVWVVTTAYGLTSAGGHASLNRLDTTGARAVAAMSYQDLRAELATARKELGFVPEHRPEATVRADIEGLKGQRFWTATSECSDPTGKLAREYCQSYHKLNAELGAAAGATKIEARIETIMGKLDKASGNTGSNSEADPQATIFSRLLRWDIASVQVGFAVLIVLVLEIGGGLGPYTALSYMFGHRKLQSREEPTPAHQPSNSALLPEPATQLQISGPTGTPQDTHVPNVSLARPPKISEAEEVAARNFVDWCCDTGRSGVKYFGDSIDAVYEKDYCEGQNRAPVERNKFRYELARLGKKVVDKDRAIDPKTGKKATYYEILARPRAKATPPINRATALDVESAPPPQPAAPGGAPQERTPFGGHASSSRLEVVKGPAVLNKYIPFLDFELQRQESRQMKAMIRQEMHRSRKQRGSRITRMARAA